MGVGPMIEWVLPSVETLAESRDLISSSTFTLNLYIVLNRPVYNSEGLNCIARRRLQQKCCLPDSFKEDTTSQYHNMLPTSSDVFLISFARTGHDH